MNRSRSIIYRIVIGFLYLMLFVSLFQSVICNDKPLIYRGQGITTFPAFQDLLSDFGVGTSSSLQEYESEHSIPCLIKYSYDFIDQEYAKSPPMTEGSLGIHWLGTDHLGRDVLAGVCRGFYIAVKVGLVTLLLSCIIGLVIGMSMGYYGDEKIKINFLQLLATLLGIFLVIFYIIYPIQTIAGRLLPLIILGVMIGMVWLSSKLNLHKSSIAWDSMWSKIIEIIKSIPSLVILLALVPVFGGQDYGAIIIILIFLTWIRFARLARAETLSLSNSQFVQAAQACGMHDINILRIHIFPHVLPTVLVAAGISFVTILMLESTLSFLGLGTPVGEVSWGSMLSSARTHLTLWWLVLFPGIALTLLISCINFWVDCQLRNKEKIIR